MKGLREHLSTADGGEILDVATGPGAFAGELADAFGSFRSLTGIDPDQDALEKAKAAWPGPRFRFEQGSAEDLPFEDAAFDTVAMSNALHHVDDTGRALAELCRVLRPGGLLVLREIHRSVSSAIEANHVRYHDLAARLDRAAGLPHNPTLTRDVILVMFRALQELSIVDHWDDVLGDGDGAPDEELDRVLTSLEGRLSRLEPGPGKEALAEEVARTIDRFRAEGIRRAPQLYLLALKARRD